MSSDQVNVRRWPVISSIAAIVVLHPIFTPARLAGAPWWPAGPTELVACVEVWGICWQRHPARLAVSTFSQPYRSRISFLRDHVIRGLLQSAKSPSAPIMFATVICIWRQYDHKKNWWLLS